MRAKARALRAEAMRMVGSEKRRRSGSVRV